MDREYLGLTRQQELTGLSELFIGRSTTPSNDPGFTCCREDTVTFNSAIAYVTGDSKLYTH